MIDDRPASQPVSFGSHPFMGLYVLVANPKHGLFSFSSFLSLPSSPPLLEEEDDRRKSYSEGGGEGGGISGRRFRRVVA